MESLWKDHQIKVHFGRWLVKGYPRCFLLDIESSRNKLSEWRRDLNDELEHISDEETNDTILFGYQVAYLLKVVLENSPKGRPVVAHFHEWLAGVGLIVANQWNLNIATLFTTHATLLGRWIAAANVDLYGRLPYFIPEEEARTRGIYSKHWIEVESVRAADVFTTVSDITGTEAKYFLGREPDIITPNGLNLERFIALHEFQNLHKIYKDKINDFVRGHFYGKHLFDLDKTLYFFTAGRNEYHNKGVDLFIESLVELNKLLKTNNSPTTVVAFIVMPGKTNSYNNESINGQSMRREILETCEKITKKVTERIYEQIMRGEIPDPDKLLSTEELVDLKRRVFSVHRENERPPFVTHNMIGEPDEIVQHLLRRNLVNNLEDKVKVIYHAEFLSLSNPLFPLDYADFVRGCHLGVFPSYYEPWGYTPTECTTMGVPSITSDLAGFAGYIKRVCSKPEANGIYIVERKDKSLNESKDQMAKLMWEFCQLNRRERITVGTFPFYP
eukprot:TRINITY_DN1610_c0_g1_i6.p1 TRINITY_DN1610_c0_g1~~TRINITY_DN1610_c0_g1_i6.p1  ORF type:complete len:579 (-),score=114.11 TRINITY_DN1610_c0_g1_i6:60-1562(-)